MKINMYESGEMYLETIFSLKKKNGYVRSVDLVNAMGFVKSSVSAAVKNLRENNFIHVDDKGYIELTEEGLNIATKIYDRHVTLTNCFARLGVPKEIAEKDACKIEHVISEETFQAIKNHI